MNFQGFLEGLQCFFLAVELHKDQTAAGKGAEVARLQLQGLGDVLKRRVVPIQQVVDRGPLVPAFGKFPER